MIDHPHQLRRIELRDFKSVAQASVDLRPLSVVIGANSSGKSTLLQSILAVTQAVRSGAASAEFPLNGEFVRLGTFDETRSFGAAGSEGQMEIAFELVAAPSSGDSDGGSSLHFAWRAFLSDDRERGTELSVRSTGFSRLASVQIEVGTLHRGG